MISDVSRTCTKFYRSRKLVQNFTYMYKMGTKFSHVNSTCGFTFLRGFLTAFTLTPPTVGRQSADLSADEMPDFSSFFIGRQKINYNYLVIFFLSSDSFGVFGNRPMIGRWSADDRPMIG